MAWFITVSLCAGVGYWLGRYFGNLKLQYEREAHANQLKSLEKSQQSQSDRFEVLAQEILDRNSLRMTQQNEKVLHGALDPLRARILEFEKRVQDVYGNEAR